MKTTTIAALAGIFVSSAAFPAFADCDEQSTGTTFDSVQTHNFNDKGTITMTFKDGSTYEGYPGAVVTRETMGIDTTKETMAYAHFNTEQCASSYISPVLSRAEIWIQLNNNYKEFPMGELSKAWIALKNVPCSAAERFIYEAYDDFNKAPKGTTAKILCPVK